MEIVFRSENRTDDDSQWLGEKVACEGRPVFHDAGGIISEERTVQPEIVNDGAPSSILKGRFAP